MVTPGGSRPAALSQRQVDDLARGQHDEAAPLLRAARHAPPAAESGGTASAPVSLGHEDMEAIVRSGAAPAHVVQRIGAAAPAAAAPARGTAKATPARQPGGSAPALSPPGPAKRS